MSLKPSCLIKVPSSVDDGTFFHWWIRFLTPFHALTDREMDVAAALFHRRFELSKTVADPVLLDKLVLNADSRSVIEKRLNLKHGYMNTILTRLRRSGVVLEDRLNPKFIPDIKPDESGKAFSVLLFFDFSHAKRDKEKIQ